MHSEVDMASRQPEIETSGSGAGATSQVPQPSVAFVPGSAAVQGDLPDGGPVATLEVDALETAHGIAFAERNVHSAAAKPISPPQGTTIGSGNPSTTSKPDECPPTGNEVASDISVASIDGYFSEEDEDPQNHRSKVEKQEISTATATTSPKWRICNWKQFKNRVEGATQFMIEALRAGDGLEEEIEEEQLSRIPQHEHEHFIRNKLESYRVSQPVAKMQSSPGGLERVRINSSIVLAFLAKISGQKVWTTRVHTFLKPFTILVYFHDQMKAELRVLAEKHGAAALAGGTTTVVGTPAIPDLKQKQPAPEEGGFGDGNRASAGCTNNSVGGNPLLHPETREAMGSLKAYEDLACYVRFVEEILKPWYVKFDNADAETPVKVQFDELRALFRPGEMIYFNPRTANIPMAANSQVRHNRTEIPVDVDTVWRVESVTPPAVEPWDVDELNTFNGKLKGLVDSHESRMTAKIQWLRGLYSTQKEEPSPMHFHVRAYSIDFNGSAYAGVIRLFTMDRFAGEREIHRLPVYPVRFVRDWAAIQARLLARGRHFQRLISIATRRDEVQAFAHSGWTRTRTPAGDIIPDDRSYFADGPGLQPQFIESDVIIDFGEALSTKPQWMPMFDKFSPWTYEPEVAVDYFSIKIWGENNSNLDDPVWGGYRRGGGGRSQLVCVKRVLEVVVSADNAHRLEESRVLERDKFIRSDDPGDSVTDGGSGDRPRRSPQQELSDEDLLLLPPRVFAYALRHRRFIQADIANIRDIAPAAKDDDPLSNLQIEKHSRRMILSILDEHFEKKKARQRLLGAQNDDDSSGDAAAATGAHHHEFQGQDFIRNKGSGVVILLYGAPGVGKTATAEAVSASWRKPLFTITCGELGVTPEGVEQRLNEIFRLANLWDCILLLDEAEVFISQRERSDTDICRNAMVSVFLRTLEYYPGILFLTTNRPGVMDEAVTSRVHVALEYPDLDWNSTLNLYRQNVRRLRKIEAERARASGGVEMEVRKGQIITFAKEQWREGDEGRWNGRQIRNAFQIAASLAHYDSAARARERRTQKLMMQQENTKAEPTAVDDKEDDKASYYIGYRHFRRVADATTQFREFRTRLLGQMDGERAQARQERMRGWNEGDSGGWTERDDGPQRRRRGAAGPSSSSTWQQDRHRHRSQRPPSQHDPVPSGRQRGSGAGGPRGRDRGETPSRQAKQPRRIGAKTTKVPQQPRRSGPGVSENDRRSRGEDKDDKGRRRTGDNDEDDGDEEVGGDGYDEERSFKSGDDEGSFSDDVEDDYGSEASY